MRGEDGANVGETGAEGGEYDAESGEDGANVGEAGAESGEDGAKVGETGAESGRAGARRWAAPTSAPTSAQAAVALAGLGGGAVGRTPLNPDRLSHCGGCVGPRRQGGAGRAGGCGER